MDAYTTLLTSYAFTYTFNAPRKYRVTTNDYDCVLIKLEQFGSIKDKTYELGSRDILHIHGVIEMSSKVKYTDLQIPSYSSRFEKLYNYEGWLNYIHKDDAFDDNDSGIGILTKSLFKKM